MTKNHVITACLALFVCVAGCAKKDGAAGAGGGAGKAGASAGAGGGAGGPGGPGGGPRGPRKFPVRVETVATHPVSYSIEAVGELVEENRFQIPAEIEGVAEKVTFSEGDQVTTGQELARINYSRVALKLEQAKSAVIEQEATVRKLEAELADAQRKTSTTIETSKLDYEQAQREYERTRRLKQGQLVSAEERETAEAKFLKAQAVYKDALGAAQTLVALAVAAVNEGRAALAAQRSELKIAEDELQKAIVRAPIAGTIQSRSITNGQYLKVGDTVGMMVQTDPVRLRFSVPESRAARLAEDMKLKFRVSAFPDKEFKADVYEVGKTSDPETHEVVCWARVSNPQGILRPGYFAKAQITAETRESAVVVPLGAVLPSEAGFVAFTVSDGTAVRKRVQTGLTITGDSIEIIKGLDPGEQLVVEGADSLQDGVLVQVVEGINRPPDDKSEIAKAENVLGGGGAPAAFGGSDSESTTSTAGK